MFHKLRAITPSGDCFRSVCGGTLYWAFLVDQTVRNLPTTQETWVQFLGQKDPQKREWLPTLVFLPGKSHGQRSLAGYSLWVQ